MIILMKWHTSSDGAKVWRAMTPWGWIAGRVYGSGRRTMSIPASVAANLDCGEREALSEFLDKLEAPDENFEN